MIQKCIVTDIIFFFFPVSEAQTWSLNWTEIIFEVSQNSEEILWHNTTGVLKKEYILHDILH